MKLARTFAWLLVLAASIGAAEIARAQNAGDETTPGAVTREEPDPTRLDVARLPPEAAEITRDLYAQGFFAEAQLGAVGFLGDLGKVAKPGPRLAITLGYELATWASLLIVAEGSLHDTKNPEPPSHTALELYGGAVGLELGVPFSARAKLFGRGLFGVGASGGDVLHPLGFDKAQLWGTNYGGELGFDWHVRSRHHSLGFLAGGRLLPSLARDENTIAVYGNVYLRYVF